MPFTLWSLCESTLLVLNAICVLHEERFLAKGCLNILSIQQYKLDMFTLLSYKSPATQISGELVALL